MFVWSLLEHKCKTMSLPLGLIMSHFHYGCFTMTVFEKNLFTYISKYWKNYGKKMWLVLSAKIKYQKHLHVVVTYCSEISGKVTMLKTEKDNILDWCLGNIHWWEVDWHWHMIFVSNGRWGLTSRPLKLPDLTLTNYVFPVLRWQIPKISGRWSTVSLQEQCDALSNSFHEQWMESKPAHLVFRIIKFGALWLFFFLWGYANMYEVGGHLMKLAVETVTSGIKRHVCPKIIHCLVVIPWKSAHEDML